MKHTVLMTSLILAGGMALAAETPAKETNSVTTAPVAMPKMGPSSITISNPAVASPVPAASTLDARGLQKEMMGVMGELRSYQTNYMATDSEIKALLARLDQLRLQEKDLGGQLQARMDALLNADPKTAALVTRRNELREAYQKTMGTPGMGGPGMNGPSMGGPGMGGPMQRPPFPGRGGDERPSVFLPHPPSAPPAPPAVPAPAPAPAAPAK